MLYKKKNESALSAELFKNPTSEYRATPFWAWNDNLEKEELLWQIDALSKMGFGGFHMHTRSGMATPYLSDEFMGLIKACVDKAKDKKMLAWLYDEDRWPSGAAGGFVTKIKKFRQKYMKFTQKADEEIMAAKRYSNYIGLAMGETPDTVVDESTGYLDGKPYLLAVYDVIKDKKGIMTSARMIAPDEEAVGQKWYAYVCSERTTGWYNGQTYIDAFSKEAVAEFLRVTHETYFKSVGSEFDKTVPAIFTDEPQFRRIDRAAHANDTADLITGWTTEFPTYFRAHYGYDLIARLPEIFWDIPDVPSTARYHFHDMTAALFAESFTKQYGEWCQKHGISMTGHLMEEPTLSSQTKAVGECMRHYGYMGLPGIDMLCNAVELNTAKQTQSAVHQYGKEGMTSELYGVTGWDFDFRGHKFQGDWQAALGVTVRVPHLSWYSMKGSAKRDYPASIHYQSCWYDKYAFVEDHFARVNTAMTRGVPCVKVGVLHPIESFWLHFGPNDTNSAVTVQMEKLFADLPQWLLGGQIDYDYISEASIPSLYAQSDDALFHLGKMQYEAIVVPALETIRSTTLDALEKFKKAGGKVLFMGEKPQYVDALPSHAQDALFAASEQIPVTENALLFALEPQRDVLLRRSDGVRSCDYLYGKRIDGKSEWLFIARMSQKPNQGLSTLPDGNRDDLTLTCRGHKKPFLFDTVTGNIRELPYSFRDDTTQIPLGLYASDSALLRLDDTDREMPAGSAESCPAPTKIIDFKTKVAYERSEANVLVLDLAEWSEDGRSFHPTEEVLRIDAALRKKYGFPDASGGDIQPWLLAGETIEHFPYLRFTIESDVSVPVELAYEELESVTLNGKKVAVTKNGYFTDKHIFKMPLGKLKKGKNVIVCKVPFGKRLSLENMFLLGEFDAVATGAVSKITAVSHEIAFGSVVSQGLPFYGAAITYRLPFECGQSDISVQAPWYKGALISCRLDGREVGSIVYAPYRLNVSDVAPGQHVLEMTLYLSRINCFGAFHSAVDDRWNGPSAWFRHDYHYSYEYQLKHNGILKSPVIEVYDK